MSVESNSVNIVWVDNNADLVVWCKHFASLAAIAVDTEFMRRTTYFPITGLIQISDGKDAVLIDPLTITDLAPLKELMVKESVIKVFHACSEDLEVFDRLLGSVPTPFYDTQVAEAYVSAQWSLSYVKLIQRYKNIEIAKDETTSDWLKRPLTDNQKRYAALDVIYLLDVYQKQTADLKDKNMYEWVIEDCEAIHHQYKLNSDPELNWMNMKAAWRLPPESLTLLRLLFIWRDEMARHENVPKGQILKDRSLWAIAKFFPTTHQALSTMEDITGRQQRLYGEHVLATVVQVKNLEKSDYQKPLEMPLPSQAGELSKAIKAFVAEFCRERQIAPEAALKKKQLEPILRHLFHGNELILTEPTMTGWRKDALITPILENFSNKKFSNE